MKHRDRVETALAHEPPDRCPLQVSFTPEFAERLRGEVKAAGGGHHNPHGGGNTYELERALDEDLLLTSVGWANSYYANELYGPGAETYVDEWGITWRNSSYATRFGPGFYTETVGRPLADEKAISSYRPPDPDRAALYDEASWVLATFGDEYWIVGVTVCTIFETAWALRGYEALLMDLHADPDLAEAVLDIPFRYHLAAAQRLTRMGVDMIWIGDDVGGRSPMLMSPEMWRRYLKPRMARFISTIKSINPGLKVAYHSDGCIISHHPRSHRGRRGRPEPGAAPEHGAGTAEEGVRGFPVLLGVHRRAADAAVRQRGRRSARKCARGFRRWVSGEA